MVQQYVHNFIIAAYTSDLFLNFLCSRQCLTIFVAIATLGIMYCIASSIVLNFKIIKERIYSCSQETDL